MLVIRFTRCTFTFGVALLAGCQPSAEGPRTDSGAAAMARTETGAPYAYERVALDTTRPPGTIIDSVFPMPEMIRRFRIGVPEVQSLTGGAESPRALVDRFVEALATKNTRALGAMTLSRAEFAWIYLPAVTDSSDSRAMPPALRWDNLLLPSEKGIARALDRIGGKALRVNALTCPSPATRRQAVVLHERCVVDLSSTDGAAFRGRLFSAIVEYHGQFKFLGYSNDM
jgi:hypothetical protein